MIDLSEMTDQERTQLHPDVSDCLGCGASTTRPDLDFQVRRVYCEDTGRQEEASFCKGEPCVDSYLRPIFEAAEWAAGWIVER